MGSSFERKKQLVQDISESYTKQIIQANQSSSVIATQFIEIVEKNNDSCPKCMLMYMSQSDIDKAFDLNDPDQQSFRKLFEKIGTGVCEGLCHITIKDIEQNNTLIYDIKSEMTISPLDINQIINDVIQKTQERYGYTDKSDTFVDNITKIINIITTNANLTSNIKQNISSQQVIEINGATSVKGVTQNLIVNAVMNAIVNSCSDEDDKTCSIDLIEQIVQQQMDFIKSEVDKNIIGNFEYVWQQSKLYFIGIGIFLLILLIIIVSLLFYKASR